MRWEAVVLAGGKLEKEFETLGDFPSKAYLPIHEKPMAAYVLDVLRRISALSGIIMVVPVGAETFPGTMSVVGGKNIVESMAAGFQAVSRNTEMVLLVTCDIPCLSQEAVVDFMRQCEDEGAGFCYSFVSRIDSEKKFPGIPHTYLRTPQGEFCGGGLIGIAPNRFAEIRDLAGRSTKSRKSLIGIAWILGIRFIVKLLLKRLSIRDAEEKVSQLFGFPAKGILSRHPELAFNVDDLKALGLAKGFIRGFDLSTESAQEKNIPQVIGPYRLAAAAGDFLYLSGQIGLNPASGQLADTTIEAQTQQVMENLRAILGEHRLEFSHIVKTTIFLARMEDFSKVNEIYGRYFAGSFPARSTVGVSALPKGALIEIEAIARRS